MRISRDDYPEKDGYYMPGEFEEHEGTLMIWPERPGSWGKNQTAAYEAFSKIANYIGLHEKIWMLVSEAQRDNAKKYLEKYVDLLVLPTDDAWARDTGPTYVINPSGGRRGIDWCFNAWGGKVDGLYATWDKDQRVAGFVCDRTGDDIYDATHFVLEGGSIHSDGQGTVIVTEECLLSEGRNPGMSKTEIENELKKYLGAKTIIWLPWGIDNDETNGHVDNICAFVQPGHVILAYTEDENHPQYEKSRAAYEVLENSVDAMGRMLKITLLPMPSKVICTTKEEIENYIFEEGEDERFVGEHLAASYANFYIANGIVLVPQFGDDNDRRALEVLGSVFEDREIIGIDSRCVLSGGGNIHCITQQIPARK